MNIVGGWMAMAQCSNSAFMERMEAAAFRTPFSAK